MGNVRTGILFAALIWAQASYVAGSPALQLVVLSDEPRKVLACMPLEAGAPFDLEFINSIYLAPVKETLVYTEGKGIAIVKVESPSAGVFEYYGLESDHTGVVRLHRSVGEIRIRSHSYENHRLTSGGRTLLFKEIADGGRLLVVEVWAHDRSCGP